MTFKQFAQIGLAVFLGFGLCVRAGAALPLAGKVIVLDPGHAAVDFRRSVVNSGKSGNGMAEHRLTLEIATYLAAMPEADGATVYITRTNADYWRTSYSAI